MPRRPSRSASQRSRRLRSRSGRLAPESALSAILPRAYAAEPHEATGDTWAEMARRAARPRLRWRLPHRAVALALLLNTPGNAAIGGGGIAMAAGIGRLLSFRSFVPSVAVAPVTLLVLVAGVAGDLAPRLP